jgi:hypothetical protein
VPDEPVVTDGGLEPSPSVPSGFGSALRDIHDRVQNDFVYHPPVGNDVLLYQEIRTRARALAHFIVDAVPAGREQSLALTQLEQAVFWANAGIARNPELEPEQS